MMEYSVVQRMACMGKVRNSWEVCLKFDGNGLLGIEE